MVTGGGKEFHVVKLVNERVDGQIMPSASAVHPSFLTLRAEFLEGNRDLIAACRAKQAFRFLSIIVKLAVSEIREGAEEGGWEGRRSVFRPLLRLPSVMGGHFRS